jgi:glycosyltransferase involved in cell wall biosynthesis
MQDIKIACYGFVDRNSGSCVKANLVILEELAKRGIKIDFFGWRGFNRAEELECYPNFRYIDLPSSSLVNSLMFRLPVKIRATVFPIVNILFNSLLHFRKMQHAIATRHATEGYDILIFLGLCAPFKINDLTTISWVQGPPRAEWDFIESNRKTIIKFCGLLLYAKLKFYYLLKYQRIYLLDQSDIAICGSQWSKEKIASTGFDPKNIYAIPYPFELDKFSFRTEVLDKTVMRSEKTLLHLGRLDPRKRLDLLLEAFSLVLQERDDVKLKIVGGFNYVPGYVQMLHQFSSPDKLEYVASVPPEQVPELMRSCDLLIQPSEGENFGSSVAEALCCGVPVIVGPTNGTKDYLGNSSFIFDDYTPKALKNTIIQALNSLEKDAFCLSIAARQAAEENFSVANVIDDFQNILNDIINCKKPSEDVLK